MDIRRTIIAVVASFLILLGWNQFSVYMGWAPDPALQPAPQAGNSVQGESLKPTEGIVATTQPLPKFQPAPGRDVVVETPLYRAVFYSGGGTLREFTLKKFNDDISANAKPLQMISPAAAAKAPLGLILDGSPTWSNSSWQDPGKDLNLQAGEEGELVFEGEVNGIRVIRRMSFNADRYSIIEKVSLLSEQARNTRLAFTMSASPLATGSSEQNLTRIAFYKDGSFKEESSQKTLTLGITEKNLFSWASVMSNYFLASVSPESRDVVLKATLEDSVYRVALEKDSLMLVPGQELTLGASYFFGPKEQSLLDAEPNDLGAAINFGMFSIISRPLLAMLSFFYGLVGNYGVAIILLTVVIKIILWPLSYKSYKSMQQMKKLQPMMAKLKEKYGDDKEGMNKEMMQLYRTYKVNPASGCLPILVQIPVFIGLYQGLLGSIQLRHASFIDYLPFTDLVWLADLSVKDPFYITPIIMGASMFLQQLLTPSTGDPTQQKIMLIMPVVFTVMFLNFPSGLVVYWLTNNIISIAQQWWQLRRA